MRFVVLTLFPGVFPAYLRESIVGRALERGIATVDLVDIRDFTTDRHRTVDDVPFGGGAGMVMKAEPVARAVESVGPVDHRVVLSASGRLFRQEDAARWARLSSLLLLCGRYEGIDERVTERCMDDAVSIGDYVLTGGELPALCVLDAVTRLLPGVLGNRISAETESFGEGLVEHPHYTRPAVWRDAPVPEVLLSGHHGEVARWRRRESIRATARRRPDLLGRAELTNEEQRLVQALRDDDEPRESDPENTNARPGSR